MTVVCHYCHLLKYHLCADTWRDMWQQRNHNMNTQESIVGTYLLYLPLMLFRQFVGLCIHIRNWNLVFVLVEKLENPVKNPWSSYSV